MVDTRLFVQPERFGSHYEHAHANGRTIWPTDEEMRAYLSGETNPLIPPAPRQEFTRVRQDWTRVVAFIAGRWWAWWTTGSCQVCGLCVYTPPLERKE